MLPHEDLTSRIIGAAFRAHNSLGPGHLEHVYRNALAILLQDDGLLVRVEVELPVHFQGVKVGREARGGDEDGETKRVRDG